jgi:hypothetical protein
MRKKAQQLGRKPFTASAAVLLHELSPEQIARQLVAMATRGDERANDWLHKFVGQPSREWPLEELADDASAIDLQVRLSVDKGRRLVWTYGGYGPLEGNGDEYALALGRVIYAGLLPQIKHCPAPGCERLFFGDKRATWCSTKCGSKARVYANRAGLSIDAWLQRQARKRKRK